MAVEAKALATATRNLVEAALDYVDSEEPGETKDLLFSLESAAMAYRQLVEVGPAPADAVCESP